jgi:hypothetical protein
VGRFARTFPFSCSWRHGAQQQQTEQQSKQFFHGQDFMLPISSQSRAEKTEWIVHRNLDPNRQFSKLIKTLEKNEKLYP